MPMNFSFPGRLRLSMIILAVAAVAAAQTAPKKQPARPAPAKPAADTPAPAPAGGLAPKGLSRVEVTPQYKEQFQSEKRVAVVAAPSYRGSGLNALRFTYVDAMDLKAELERQGYTVMLVSPSEATSDNVRKALQDAKQLLDGNNQGSLLFAFSGHGFQTGKGNYLVTVGATPANVESEALALDEVEKLMTATGARRKVILVDACRNDPDAKSTDTPRTFSQFQEAEGTSILLSTRPGGFSYEDSDLGHGIFTYYLLEGLRGKAAGKDGYVTFFDLQKYVENGVVRQSLKKDRVQRPFVMGERSGDFLLATAAPAKPEEIPPAPSASTAIDSNSLVLREVVANGGNGRSYFALLSGGKLTLVDAKTMNPLVEVADAGELTSGYRHFKGNGSNREVFDFAVEVKGDDILGIKGRVGTACPQDKPCTTPSQVPPLPGEKFNSTRNTASTVGGVTGAVRGGLARLGRGSKTADTTQVGAESGAAAMDAGNPLLKFQWKGFELTSNLPKKK
jgi:hypothetical protein